jgi:hypothetical protein
MAKAKHKGDGIPPRQPGEEPATANQLEYLKSLADFNDADLKALGKYQASWLIEKTKEARELAKSGKSTTRKSPLGLFTIATVFLGLALWGPNLPKLWNQWMNPETPIQSTSGKPNPPSPPRTGNVPKEIENAPDTPALPDAADTAPSPPLATLANLPLPATLTVIDPVSLLNATGKEVTFPVDTLITVENRSAAGTLTMKIEGELFVGNESRLAGKVKSH